MRTDIGKKVGTEKTEAGSKVEYGDTSRMVGKGLFAVYIVPLIFRLTGLSFAAVPHLHAMDTRDPSTAKFAGLVSVAAAVLSMIALLLRIWAMRTLGRFFSRRLGLQGSTHRVVQEGPYSLVRHPGYASNAILMPAYTVVVCGDFVAGALCYAYWLWIMLGYRIPVEEEMLLGDDNIGDEYKKYKGKVTGRIVPGLI